MMRYLLFSGTLCMYCTKMAFSIKDFFSKCDQIRSFLRIWSHLLNKSLMENFIFCAVIVASIISCLSNNILQKNKLKRQYLVNYKHIKIDFYKHHSFYSYKRDYKSVPLSNISGKATTLAVLVF